MAGNPGVGSGYTSAYRDANSDRIDPARTYRPHLPGPTTLGSCATASGLLFGSGSSVTSDAR